MKINMILASLLLATSGFAQYRDSESDYSRSLERQYDSVSLAASSPRVDMYDVVMNWCEDSVSIIEDALQRFRTQLYAGRNAAAFRELQKGLYQVSSSRKFGSMQSPFVKLAADRAYLVSSKLQKKGMQSDLGGLHALESLARNVITVAYRFDQDYYVPYVYKYGRRCDRYCDEGFVERMEREALSFAQNQIDAVTDKLTTQVGYEYRPIGHASVYLTTAEVIAINTAHDLSANIFASRIPCTIRDLRNTGLQLRSFNAGNMSYYGSVRTAVHESASSLAEVSSDIHSASYCRRW